MFNSEYELIGAGAVLTPEVGGIRSLLQRNFTIADGIWFFHLIIGTTSNCIVDVTFRYDYFRTMRGEVYKFDMIHCEFL